MLKARELLFHNNTYKIYLILKVIQFLHSLFILVAMNSNVKSYFECQRRDLRNKANNEEEKIKARKKSLDLLLSKEIKKDSILCKYPI